MSKETAHYDFFVSGRWRNKDAVIELARKIRELGYSAYCFLDANHNIPHSDVDPHEHIAHFESLSWRNDPYVREVFEEDMNGQKNSSAFVMLLPAGKSCHIEAGTAYGMGKKCILIGEQKEAESLYLIFDEVYPTVDAFMQSLSS